MPPAQAGGKQAAMSAPLTYGIAAKAKHADCAAFFLNWVATNQRPATIDVRSADRTRWVPPVRRCPRSSPARSPRRPSRPARSIGKDNGAMDFIANATGAIYATRWTPELQKLVAGQQTPRGCCHACRRTTRRNWPVSSLPCLTVHRTASRWHRGRAPAALRARTPGARRARRARWAGLAVRRSGAGHVRVVRPAAPRPHRPVLALRVERHRRVDLGRAWATTPGLHRPDAAGIDRATRSS